MIRRNVKRLRLAIASMLRAAAKRLDPPVHPYGEWDPKTSQLVIKVPTGGSGYMKLASVDVAPGIAQIGSDDIQEYRL